MLKDWNVIQPYNKTISRVRKTTADCSTRNTASTADLQQSLYGIILRMANHAAHIKRLFHCTLQVLSETLFPL